MKCRVEINEGRDEEVVIYAKEITCEVEEIRAFVTTRTKEFIGYGEGKVVKLLPREVFCFSVEGGRVYAHTEREKLLVKERLYTIEEKVESAFVRINQSCLVNVALIDRFDVSFGAALVVRLKNGYKDYVSRRQVKKVKERIGLVK